MMRKGKFLSVLLLLALLLGAGFMTATAESQAGNPFDPPGDLLLSPSPAGLPPLPPVCPTDPGPQRHSDLPPAPLRPGTGNEGVACRAIPTGVRTVPPAHGPVDPSGMGILSVGYHHMGAQTGQDNLSIWGQIFVSDPATRGGTNDSVFARFLEKSGGNWIEVGWVEGGGGDQCVYAFDSNSGGHDFCQYDLSPGQGIYVQLEYLGYDPPLWGAYLYWNGQWIELLRASLGFAYADGVEEYVEIYTADGFHFNVLRTDVGPPVQIQIGGTFDDWTPTYPTSENNWMNRYHVHWQTKYYDWYVHTH